jgi:hypothetical protein
VGAGVVLFSSLVLDLRQVGTIYNLVAYGVTLV